MIRCPRCGHEGTIGKRVPTTMRLTCRSCSAKMLLRHAIPGENGKPCRWRQSNDSLKAIKSARAQDVLRRFSPISEHGDEIPEL